MKIRIRFPRGPAMSITYTHEGAALFGALRRRGVGYRKAENIVCSLMGKGLRRNIERCRKQSRVQPSGDDTEDSLAKCAISRYKLDRVAESKGIRLPKDLLPVPRPVD
jgi:hypothetical protein